MSFLVGDSVKVIGGNYEGEIATIYSISTKTVRLMLSGGSEPTGNVPFKNVSAYSLKKEKQG